MTVETYQGDCLDILPTLPDHSVDLVLVDLPYGVTQNKWDTSLPMDKLWEQYKRLLKKHSPVVLFGLGKFAAKLILSNEAWYRYSWIWHKPNPTRFLDARRRPLLAHEEILVFSEYRSRYIPQMRKGVLRKRHYANDGNSTNYGAFKRAGMTRESDEYFPRTVLKFGNYNQPSYHPTQKPVDLLCYLIQTYTNEGDTVLDHCAGSGSVGVACQSINQSPRHPHRKRPHLLRGNAKSP